MSFREQRAWVTLVTLVVVLIVFWLHIPPTQMLRTAPDLRVLHVLMLTVASFVLIKIIAHVVMVIRSPRDARTPKDERDQLIGLKGTAIAWYVFVILSLGGIFVTIHLGANEIGVGFVVLLSFVIAEIVNCAMRIYYYRRGF